MKHVEFNIGSGAVNQVSCVEDAHAFIWMDDESRPSKCICGRVEYIDGDDRVMHRRRIHILYGNFSTVPLTVNQEEPYFVHEWDATD